MIHPALALVLLPASGRARSISHRTVMMTIRPDLQLEQQDWGGRRPASAANTMRAFLDA